MPAMELIGVMQSYTYPLEQFSSFRTSSTSISGAKT